MSRWLLLPVIVVGLVTTAACATPFAIGVMDYQHPELPCPNCEPNDALGAPDAAWYSIGPEGWVELELGEPVLDVAGTDLIVWEELTAFWDGNPGSEGSQPD